MAVGMEVQADAGCHQAGDAFANRSNQSQRQASPVAGQLRNVLLVCEVLSPASVFK